MTANQTLSEHGPDQTASSSIKTRIGRGVVGERGTSAVLLFLLLPTRAEGRGDPMRGDSKLVRVEIVEDVYVWERGVVGVRWR